jgi:DNA processing protein
MPPMISEPHAWLAFSLMPDIGYKRIRQIEHLFGSLPAAFHATLNELRDAGLDHRIVNAILAAQDGKALQAALAKTATHGITVLTFIDEDYPALLREIPDPPAVLYLRGALTEADQRALAIVGTRRATSYGRDATLLFARGLAQAGVTIVSGLAQGIDAAAHTAALDHGGRTIAVLGTGADQVYPREHARLAQRIVDSGALISEFPVGTPPEPFNFPRRNRIISGISLGVLVVEAPEKSGALITATTAAEQGRDVFAVPGNIFSRSASGTNRLIQDGAQLVTDAGDILGMLNLAHEFVQTREAARDIGPVSGDEATVMALLTHEPLHVDDICRASGLPVHIITSTLTMLELKGLARMVGHMQYSLNVNR